MNIVSLDINDINPYEKNAKKHTKEQIKQIAESIKQFGLTRPLGIWSNENILVYGHGTYEALKLLEYSQVECVRLDYMTDDERRAYTLVDNKLQMNTDFDMDILMDELFDIDIDLGDYDLSIPEQKEDDSYYGDERERTFDYYNMYDVNLDDCVGKYQMPMIKATRHIPEDLLSFNYMLTSNDYDKGIHFFIDDYQFERIWNDPHKYIEKLSKFDCVLTPDFSLYREMPVANQIWNVYRSRLIGYIMQQEGLTVIPTLQWCTKESYNFSFDGIEPCGTVAVSTIGVKQDDIARKLFFEGMNEAMKRLIPECVINYGGDIGYNYDCKVIYISNHNADNLHDRSKK